MISLKESCFEQNSSHVISSFTLAYNTISEGSVGSVISVVGGTVDSDLTEALVVVES